MIIIPPWKWKILAKRRQRHEIHAVFGGDSTRVKIGWHYHCCLHPNRSFSQQLYWVLSCIGWSWGSISRPSFPSPGRKGGPGSCLPLLTLRRCSQVLGVILVTRMKSWRFLMRRIDLIAPSLNWKIRRLTQNDDVLSNWSWSRVGA